MGYFWPQFENLEVMALPNTVFNRLSLFAVALLFDSNVDSLETLESIKWRQGTNEGRNPMRKIAWAWERGLLSVGVMVGLLTSRRKDFGEVAGDAPAAESFFFKIQASMLLSFEFREP